jgi:hypothetical protein
VQLYDNTSKKDKADKWRKKLAAVCDGARAR